MLENKDRPHVKPGPIKYTKGFRLRRLLSKIVNSIIILLIAAIVALAVYVFVKQPVKHEEGYVTATPIYEFIEHGQKVIIVNDDNFHMFTPLTRFLFTQEVHLAEVVAGPYGVIGHSQGKHRVMDGSNVIRVNLETLDEEYLDLEYIVRKVNEDGSPVENEYDLIVTKEKILGSINVQK